MVSIKKLYAVIALSVSFLFAKSQVSNAELKSLNSYCECEHVFTNNEDSGSSFLGKKILQTGYEMALINKTIVRGSCWNFVNEVYQRNGFALTKKQYSNPKNQVHSPPHLWLSPATGFTTLITNSIILNTVPFLSAGKILQKELA